MKPWTLSSTVPSTQVSLCSQAITLYIFIFLNNCSKERKKKLNLYLQTLIQSTNGISSLGWKITWCMPYLTLMKKCLYIVCYTIFKCIKNVSHGENCSESNVLPAIYPERVTAILLCCTPCGKSLVKVTKRHTCTCCVSETVPCVWEHAITSPSRCGLSHAALQGVPEMGKHSLEGKIYQISLSLSVFEEYLGRSSIFHHIFKKRRQYKNRSRNKMRKAIFF